MAWYLFASTSIIAYFVIMHGLRGQTVGKKLCEVKVLDVSETRLSFKQAVWREIFPIITTVVAFAFETEYVIQGVRPYPLPNLLTIMKSWGLQSACGM